MIKEPYYADNILEVQKYEDTHWWYATTFSYERAEDARTILCFEGIDTIADIYLNGKLLASTDNMLISHEFDITQDILDQNSLVVHLKPVCILARANPVNAENFAYKYWYEALRIRKPIHMYGWDIMPRAVSAGLWRSVYIREQKIPRISEFYIYPRTAPDLARFVTLTFLFNIEIDEREDIRDFEIEVSGVCEDSTFCVKQALWSCGGKYKVEIENPRLWYPAGRGAQNMYNVTARLLKLGNPVATYSARLGIRSVELLKTSVTDADGSGEFCFVINGEKVFVTGNNWVPHDAFHSQDKVRLKQALE